MRKLTLALAGALLLPAIADAQIRASAGFSIDLPVVLPQLVVIQPGIQVVPECDHEVFYTSGYYWVRERDVWYRSRSHRGGWTVARTTLMFERSSIGSFSALRHVDKLLDLVRRRGAVPGVVADRIARLYTHAKGLDLLNKRMITTV